jgi:hypothetical protein
VLVDVAEEGALDHVLKLLGGIPAKTVPLFVSSVSNRARTAAAFAAPVLRRATVSDLVQLANSLECWAFISSVRRSSWAFTRRGSRTSIRGAIGVAQCSGAGPAVVRTLLAPLARP